MYLTAQRVVSQDGKAGINAFSHSHPSDKQPVLSNYQDVISVAENNTGELVRDCCAIPPGGNRVKSYLDIVAFDGIDKDSLNAALEKFRKEIVIDKMGPILQIVDGIGLRFNAEFGLFDAIIMEYDELKESALSLFEKL